MDIKSVNNNTEKQVFHSPKQENKEVFDDSIFDKLDKNQDGIISADESKEYGFSAFDITEDLSKDKFLSKLGEYNKQQQSQNKSQLWEKQPLSNFASMSYSGLKFDDKTQQYMVKYRMGGEYVTYDEAKAQGVYGLSLADFPIENIDFTQNPELLREIAFNDKTFTSSCKLPKDYNPKEIMKQGMNPGGNVREMHKSGITGKGVKIAIIDELLSPHEEYNSNIKCYEKMKNIEAGANSFHGTPVVSIAAGKNCGVAKDADVFFFAAGNGKNGTQVAALKRVLEINSKLPQNERIRVVSISNDNCGGEEGAKLINQLKDSGCWVITSDEFRNHFGYLEKKNPMGNPDDFSNYKVCHQGNSKNPLYINSGHRTVADCTNSKTYRHDSIPSASWSVPYVAGLYTCACQADSNITPGKFLEAAHKTARRQQVEKTNEQAKMEIHNNGLRQVFEPIAAKIYPNVPWDEIRADEKKWAQTIASVEQTYGGNEKVMQQIDKSSEEYRQQLIKEGKIDKDYNYLPPYDKEEISIIDAKALMDYLKENKN